MKSDDWIPVSEKLPPKGEIVWVTIEYKNGRYMDTAEVVNDKGEGYSHSEAYIVSDFRREVVAWMRTPEPYEGPK